MSLSQIFTTKGRLNRLPYFLYGIGISMVAGIVLVLFMGLFAVDESLGILGMFVYFIFALAIIPVNICLSIRRLHDLNQSGWLLLLHFVPYIGSLGLCIYLTFIRGTYGPNKYGPDPLLPDFDGQNQMLNSNPHLNIPQQPAMQDDNPYRSSYHQVSSGSDNVVASAVAKFCPSCGSELSAGAKFCGNCGSTID